MSRLPPHVQARHDDAVRRGRSGYMDPDCGLFVLTASYLEQRGWCCGQGCRHCPYPPDDRATVGERAK